MDTFYCVNDFSSFTPSQNFTSAKITTYSVGPSMGESWLGRDEKKSYQNKIHFCQAKNFRSCLRGGGCVHSDHGASKELMNP